MTTSVDTIPADTIPATTSRRRSTAVRFVVAFLVGILAILALGVGALYAYDREYEGRVLPGVRVGTTDLSGLSQDAARDRLAEGYAHLSRGAIVLSGPTGEITIGYADVGRGPDLDAMVAAALGAGRSGGVLERFVGNARTALDGVVVEPAVTYDRALVEAAVARIARALALDPVDAAVTKTEEGFELTTSEEGRALDTTALLAALEAPLASLDAPAEVTIELPVLTVPPVVDTAEATAAKASAERMTEDMVLKRGKEAWTIKGSKLRELVSFSRTVDGGYVAMFEVAGLQPLVKAFASDIARKAQNASFKLSGGRITGVIPSRDGRTLNVASTTNTVFEAMLARRAGAAEPTLQPTFSVRKPALTTEEAEAAAPKMRRLPGGKWTTWFPIGPNNGFGANIWIPAMDIDGQVVAPGEWFDFWKSVGPVTRARGYRDGGAIINGRTEPQGALAGGICSCSTTFFNAALRAGLQMGERRNHYYYIDRYPLGLDATVFKSGSGSVQTMSWRNDTDHPILVRAYKSRDGGRGYITVELFGVPTGRKVSFSRPIVKNIRPASDSVQRTASLPAGTSKRVEYPVDGKDVWVTRTVRDRNGRVIHRETYYSHYARITGIVLVGTGGSGSAGGGGQ